MSTFNRKFIAAAAASTLMAVLGVARAQIASEDSAATPAQVAELKRNGSPHILYFLDQGISASTDPAAHLLLIKTVQPTGCQPGRQGPRRRTRLLHEKSSPRHIDPRSDLQ